MAIKKNILFCGKDSLWCQVLKDAFPCEANVFQAIKGELLQEIKKRKYSFIVIDTLDLTEDELHRKVELIKSIQKNTRIIITSTSPEWQAVRKAFKRGVTDYITKSFNPETIKRYLNSYI